MARADTLLDQLKALGERAWQMLDKAERANDLRTALLAIAQVREALESRGREAEPRTWAELAEKRWRPKVSGYSQDNKPA